MIVTKIERQKKDPDRYSIYLDGAFAIGVRSAVLLRAGLRKGDDVSHEMLESLRGDEDVGAARAAALRHAGRKRRTEHEVREKLASLEFSPTVIDAVVGSLRDSGVLDDRAYVRAYIHDTQMRRPAGPRMIAFRLRGKGVPPDLLRDEIEAALGPAEETPLARRLARRYAEKLVNRTAAGKTFLPGEREAIIRRYLAGRGFGRDAVEAAVRAVAGGARTED
jgi:regulatory protein